jgi:hypothetical protein
LDGLADGVEALDEMAQHLVFSLDDPIVVDFRDRAFGCTMKIGEEVMAQSALGPDRS